MRIKYTIPLDKEEPRGSHGTSTPSSKAELSISNLYQQYAKEITGYIRKRFTSSSVDPEDITQQAFEKILQAKSIHNIRNVRAYIYKAAHNVALTHNAKKANRVIYAAKEITAKCPELSDDITPERVLLAKERASIIKKAITNMPLKRRQSFIMHRIHGLSCAEIARRTGYSESAIKKHIRLAMEDISVALEIAEHTRGIK